MAKAKPATDPVVAGLRAAVHALPNLLPLVGSKGKALFTKAEASAAEQAVAAGYLTKREVSPPPVKGKKKPGVVYGLLTEAGARKVALGGGDDGVRAILNDLRDGVTRLGSSPRTGGDGVAAAIDRAAETCAAALKAAVSDLRAEVLAAVTAGTGANSADPGPVLAALRSALDRVGAEPTVIKVPVVSDAPTGPRDAGLANLPDDALAFVAAVARERSVGCDVAELYDHLRTRHPGLSIGAFHDALRQLDAAGRVRLRDWPRMLDEMPRPELALFINHTVMYHVQPAR
ncbi:unnamed protein product [Gemmataceae bacterium]|nr:unnamed protein product [Gemmataceae bacterium]VTT98994.1 unnamed protein product [Gemmataceae bacterium]